MTAMNLNLLSATRTVEATMPFILYRLAVCLGVALASLFAALAGAGTFIAFASFSAKRGAVGDLGAALSLGALAFLLYRFRAGLFFNIQAGHLALLSELASGARLPAGKAQIDLAKQKASQHFPSPSGFQEIRLAVRQVLGQLPKTHCPLLDRLQNRPLSEALAKAAGWMAQTADLALLSNAFLQQGNPWQSARSGLLKHVRHFDLLSKSRMALLGFEYAGLFFAYLAVLYPIDSAASSLPVDVGLWRYLFAFIFAWSLKAAFFEPIATTALASLYFDLEKDGGAAVETDEEPLLASSDAFRAIVAKAR